MFDNTEQFRMLLTGVLMFGLTLSIWWIVVLWWANRRAKREWQLQKRLGVADEGDGEARMLRLWHDGQEATVFVPLVRRKSLGQRLVKLPQELGWYAPIQSILLGLIGAAMLIFIVIFVVLGNALVAVGAAALVFIVFWIFVQQRLAKRLELFERQLVDALELVARSLRAGHPLLASFQMTAEELEAPLAPIFAEICQQQQLGVDMESALRHAAAASHSEDMRLFATSVAIQLRSGGNLADMMHRLAEIIRQRIRLSRRVRVLTAQTQFSKRILLALPLIVFVLLNTINPGYMHLLYATTVGQMMLGMTVVSLALGSWVMNRMSKVYY